ncbi:hypothetical protein [Burkholderia gladioli]|uniref:hypothetical protein n=1 Tax=Burkholderia gladioli TaxID=28095 RepID=UPI0015E711F6|nr:hypothetical protein [Burkholderia gladioli]
MTNTTTVALTDEQRIIEMAAEHGIGPTSGLGFARALLTCPRAAVPAPHAWKLVPIEPTKEMMNAAGGQAGRFTAKIVYTAMLDAAPAAPVAEPAHVDLALIVAALEHSKPTHDHYPEARERHRKALESARSLVAGDQAVAADGEAQDDIEGIARAAGCTNVDLIGDRAKAIERLTAFAVRVRAAVSPATADGLPAWFDTFLTNVCEIPDRSSPEGEPDAIIATLEELKNCALNAIEEGAGDEPATADRICTLIPLSERHPIADDHPRVIVFTDGSDFNGAQFFDVSADTLNECFYESPEHQPEVCRHATHWMPRPSLRHAAPATADERAEFAYHDDPANTGVGTYCNPGDRREPRWLLQFEDADRGVSIYESESDARKAFAHAEGRGYNCYLFSPTLRASQAAAPADAREPSAWVTPEGDRSITQSQKQGMLRDGGAGASSVQPFSIACYAGAVPADAGEAVARAYPDSLTEDLRHVLGFPNFRCGPYANLMRAAGADIQRKSEDEQAHVLHWLIKLVIDHGERWADVAQEELDAMREKVAGHQGAQGGKGGEA